MVDHALIGVEGNHDQALIGRVLKKFLGFKLYDGSKEDLDQFWEKLIPRPTPKGKTKLYDRLNLPSIFSNDTLSVAIYMGEGNNLLSNLDDVLSNEDDYQDSLSSFVVIVDADNNPIDEVVKPYVDRFRLYFPNFPDKAGEINHSDSTSTGIYVLPNNTSQGTLDQLLCQCGEVAYSEFMSRGKVYLETFTADERKKLKWKPFTYEKALIATIVSVLKPGMTNTASISQNDWISEQTRERVDDLKQLVEFIVNVLKINN